MFGDKEWGRPSATLKSKPCLDSAGGRKPVSLLPQAHLMIVQSDRSSLPTAGALGDIAETTYATVLFVDLRGYCTLSERLPAEQIVPLLKDFFRILVRACDRNAGLIYHLAGDGLMAAFGIGTPSASGAPSALSAAREMLEHFTPIAACWNETLSLQAGIGIGINAGEVAFLTVDGMPDLRSSTLIGDTVNVAARLCDRARAGEILFSDSVALGLSHHGSQGMSASSAAPRWLRLANVYLHGRIAPVDVWCLPAPARVKFRDDTPEPVNVIN
jgi:class 3 adenylate cyclase